MMQLNYFNGRGLAEVSRLLFAASGTEYTDFRYPLTVLDWSTYKMVKDEFDEDKTNNKLWKSLNKVPFLEVDNEVIFQSKAIERFLARRFFMMGKNSIEEAFIDSVCETIRDLKDEFQKTKIGTTEEKELAVKKYFRDTLPTILGALNRIINSKNVNIDFVIEFDTYTIGEQLSLADIVIFSFLTDFFDDKEAILKSYENFDNLKEIVKTVKNRKCIQKWLAKRPETPF